MILAIEEWRSTTVRGYDVSSFGRVRNQSGRILSAWKHRSGHLYINLGRGCRCQVHRLVLMAFHEMPQPSGSECLHIDGIPTNNSATNLRWGTRRENVLDGIRHRGRPPHSCLTYEIAARIRTRLDGSRGCQARLAREFGISESIVSRIAKGHTYAEAL